MSSSNKIRTLHKTLQNEIQGVTPGLCLRVLKKGRVVCDLEVGDSYPYYDLASLTKVIFTMSAAMWALSKKEFSINVLTEPVQKSLPWFEFRNIIVQSLLTHTSHLNAWQPFYKTLKLENTKASRWENLKVLLNQSGHEPLNTAVYSDLGILTFGHWLERIQEKPLLSIWQSWSDSMEFEHLRFHDNNVPVEKRSLYAPTEDCPWRKKTLQGEVHDDNTWALGGVAPHAGLFGGLDDIEKWALQLRNSFLGTKKTLIDPKIARLFCSRSIPSSVGDWGLGFMLPTKGSASCGKHFHESSFGHTGFTGTSFWFDPKADFMVILLSNRVHPTRNNEKFKVLRPKIHDLLYEMFA
jgi:CubicO group peptidase (beta-lactamase class C family)